MQDKLMTSSYSPVLTTKAVKDDTEQQILRDAHVCHLHTDTHKHTWLWTFLKKKTLVVVIYQAEFTRPDMSLLYIYVRPLSFQVFTVSLNGGTFMNRFHLELQHFSGHTPWYIHYPVQRCLNKPCNMSCKLSVCMFCVAVIDAEKLLACVCHCGSV